VRRVGPALAMTALAGSSLFLSACAGRVKTPSVIMGRVSRTPTPHPVVGTSASGIAPGGGGAAPTTAATEGGEADGQPPTTTTAATSTAAAGAGTVTSAAVVAAYESYLSDLSGLDDTLSKSYLAPLASVTTSRLADATVRQAAALEAAGEHGVGQLRDDHVRVVMTGPGSAAIADCQDEYDFYVVTDTTGAPDSFVARGDFAGSAQLVLQGGHWLVDVFSTTHVRCTF